MLCADVHFNRPVFLFNFFVMNLYSGAPHIPPGQLRFGSWIFGVEIFVIDSLVSGSWWLVDLLLVLRAQLIDCCSWFVVCYLLIVVGRLFFLFVVCHALLVVFCLLIVARWHFGCTKGYNRRYKLSKTASSDIVWRAPEASKMLFKT